jgi:hypothetical protein
VDEYPDRAAAKAASRGCEYCGGEGLATVWHPSPDPTIGIPRTIAAFCTCPHGRYMMKTSRMVNEWRGVYRGTPDLARVLGGKSIWLAHDPALGPESGS